MENNVNIWTKGKREEIDSKGNVRLLISHTQHRALEGFIPVIEGPEYYEAGSFFEVGDSEAEAYDKALSQGLYLLQIGYLECMGR